MFPFLAAGDVPAQTFDDPEFVYLETVPHTNVAQQWRHSWQHRTLNAYQLSLHLSTAPSLSRVIEVKVRLNWAPEVETANVIEVASLQVL